MIIRKISSYVQRLAMLYPAIGITGPRQSGKTTLAKMLFPHLPYVSLEDLDTRLRAQSDTRGFLELYKNGAIFDEIQHAPELLSYLQGVLDSSPETGRYIITGSQNFALSETISQSLAGRIGMVTLLPLSMEELAYKEDPTQAIFKGGYPRLHTVGFTPTEFFPSYIQTYIERDIRSIKSIENLSLFKTFLALCAGRTGQLLNLSSLAQDCGISHTTARQWLTLLEASYLICLLQPFHQNFNKRLIKMPKIYFYDTGIVCSLLGIEKADQLENHYIKGSLYENLIVMEVMKHRLNQGLNPHLYFWRDQTGHEVDLIGQWSGKIHAIEIKSSSTFQKEFLKNLNFFSKLAPDAQRYLISNSTQTGKFLETLLVPVSHISTVL